MSNLNSIRFIRIPDFRSYFTAFAWGNFQPHLLLLTSLPDKNELYGPNLKRYSIEFSKPLTIVRKSVGCVVR
jgi:hypothetical protein